MAGGAYLVIQFLKRALGPRDEDRVRALGRVAFGNGPADPARGTGNEGQAALKAAFVGCGHR